MKNVNLFSLVILFLSTLHGQPSQLRLEGQPQKLTTELVAVRDVNGRICAAIQVRSNMEGLRYDSYNGVVRVDPNPGEDMVFVSPDERVLKIFKAGYEPLQIFLYEAGINLNPKDVWQIRITGDAQTLPVSIIVEPEDAQILLDGTDIGKGPSFKLPTGKHTLKVSHPDFEPQEGSITIDDDHTLFRYTLKRRETAILSVTSDPSGADLYLDGNLIGITPYDGMILSGSYILEARKNLYLTTRKEINIRAGLTTTENIPLTPNFGFMEITSQPDGAQVYIDNRLVGQTPYKSIALECGDYKVRVSKELNYSMEQYLTIQNDSTTTHNFVLEQAHGGISIYSNPEAAEVYLNDSQVGITPFQNPDLSPGNYKLTLKKDMYQDVTKNIKVIKDILFEETIELLPHSVQNRRTMPTDARNQPNLGTIHIKTPADATVFIDGRPIRGGNSTYRLPAGIYTIEVFREKHYPIKKSINIMAGTEQNIELYPQLRIGEVVIFVTPQGARDAQIKIDGMDFGEAPKIIPNLMEGFHILELRKNGYLPFRSDINIRTDKPNIINAEMTSYVSIQAEKDRWGRKRNWTLLGTAIFAGATGGLKYMADQRYEDYKRAKLTKDADVAQKEVENYDTYAKGALIGTGVMALWTIYNQLHKFSIIVPKYDVPYDSIQAEKDRWGARRNGTFLATAVFAGAAGWFKYLADMSQDDYKKASMSTDVNEAYKNMKNYNNYMKGALIGTGIVGLLTLYNTIRWATVKIPSEQVTVDYDPRTKQLAVKVYF